MGEFAVGQMLYLAFSDGRGNVTCREMEITKIGRKWITVGTGYLERRICMESMNIDGGQYSTKGKAYLSEQHYNDEKERQQLYRQIRKTFDGYGGAPGYMTLDILRQINEIIAGSKPHDHNK